MGVRLELVKVATFKGLLLLTAFEGKDSLNLHSDIWYTHCHNFVLTIMLPLIIELRK